MFDRLFNSTKILEKSLNATWARNEAISQNLANVETPGYKRKDVPFEQRLKEAMDDATPVNSTRTAVSKVNVDDIDISIEEDNSSLSMRLDGNNVDVDSEAAQLAKNSIKYNVLTDALNSQYKRLRTVITEGRR